MHHNFKERILSLGLLIMLIIISTCYQSVFAEGPYKGYVSETVHVGDVRWFSVNYNCFGYHYSDTELAKVTISNPSIAVISNTDGPIYMSAMGDPEGDSFYYAFTFLKEGTVTISSVYPDGYTNWVASITVLPKVENKCTLQGIVYDEKSGIPIQNATVSVADKSCLTDGQGNYIISDIVAGTYGVTVMHDDYCSVTKSVEINQPLVILNLPMSKNQDVPVIKSITSKYSSSGEDKVFLNGSSLEADFVADVDWGNHEPGVVRFMTTDNIYVTSGSVKLNYGVDFGHKGRLKAIAISSDGAHSDVKDGGFVVVNPPDGLSFTAVDNGGLKYISDLVLAFIPPQKTDLVPDEIPIINGCTFTLDTEKSNVNLTAGTDGVINFDIGLADGSADGEKKIFKLKPSWELGGDVSGALSFILDRGSYNWDVNGQLTVSGSGNVKLVSYCAVGGLPVYLEGDIGGNGSGTIGIDKWTTNPQFNWSINLAPYARAAVGAGINDVVSVEGYGKVTGDINFKNTGVDYKTYVTIGIEAVLTSFIKYDAFQKTFVWPDEAKQSTIQNMMLTNPNRNYEPIPRNYLEQGKLKTYASSSSSNTQVLQSNVFPYSESTIANANGKNVIVWVQDNPSRSNNNRTELNYTVSSGDSWSAPKPITNDNTADFKPEIAATSNGVVAAWENMNSPIEEMPVIDDDAIKQVMSQSEISVAKYDSNTDSWSGVQNLTSDNVLDRSPQITTNDNESMVVWVKNENNDYFGSSQSPNKIMFSKSNASSWDNPQLIATVPHGIVKSSLLLNGTKGIFAYIVDMDDNMNTSNDQELYVVSYENGIWGAPVRITDNTISDTNPKLCKHNGSTELFWSQGGNIVCLDDLTRTTPSNVIPGGQNAMMSDFEVAVSSNDEISLVWTGGTKDGQGLFAATYDNVNGLWNQNKLTDDQFLNRSHDVVYNNGELLAVYNKVSIIQDVDSNYKSGAVDLCTAKLKKSTDLELGDIQFTESNPQMGQPLSLNIPVKNCGTMAVKNIDLEFYDDDPLNTGRKIGDSYQINDVILSGETKNITTTIPLPNDRLIRRLYVVMNGQRTVAETNYNNNTKYKDVVYTDIGIMHLERQDINQDKSIITANIKNNGLEKLTNITVKLYKDAVGSDLIGTNTISKMDPGEKTDTMFVVDAIGTDISKAIVVLELPNGMQETNTTNNVSAINLESSLQTTVPIISNMVFTEEDDVKINSLSATSLKATACVMNPDKLQPASYTFVLALYDANRKLIKLSIEKKEIPADTEQDLSAKILMPENADQKYLTDGTYAKVFLWNDFITDQPMIAPVCFGGVNQ